MNGSRFDRIARLFADRRLSRRVALAAGGLAGLGFAGVSAQDLTPAATPAGTDDGAAADGSVLFVQTAASGSFVANPGSGTPEVEGTPTPGGGADYLLTLGGHPGGTVYFTDRPQRVFGEAPTQRFLDGLGFSPADPPNAALVVQTDGGEDVIVLELLNPAYDETAGTVTYGANILAEYDGDSLAHAAARQQDASLPERFGRTSLFIDDCDSHEIVCYTFTSCEESSDPGGPCDSVEQGSLGTNSFCWHFGDICCGPCDNHDGSHWNGVCNDTFAGCNGSCIALATNNSCWNH